MAITKVTRTLLSTGIVDNSNATAITIDSSENVGIGTSSPATGLEVATTNYTFAGTNFDIYGLFGDTSGGIRLGADSSNEDSVIGTTGTNNLQFVTYNGSAWGSRMTLTNTGNVGIGTTSPLTQLHISGTANNTYIRIDDGSEFTNIGVDATGSFYNTNTNHRFLTASGGTEALRITDTGNVGIGTTSPSQKLDIDSGYLNFSNNYGIRWNGATSVALYGNQTSNFLAFQTSSSEKMRIDSSGNVGIGVSDIGSAGLSLSNSMNFNISEGANSSFVNIFRQASSAATVIANGYKYTDTANKVASSYASSWAKSAIALNYGNTIFYNDAAATAAVGTDVTPTERMRIDSSGNVGIGTTSPRTQTHILGTGQLTANITDSGNQGGTLTLSQNSNLTNSGGALLFAALNDSGNYKPQAGIKSLLSNGVGQGTGSLAFSIRATSGDTALTERMRIDSSGNVGIGTSSPSYKLDVWDTGGGNIASFTNGVNADLRINCTSGVTLLTPSTGTLAFGTSNTERMRIDSSGVISADGVYNTTSSDAANVRVLSNGNIVRSTSSERYKNTITDASKGLTELNNLRPVTYKGNNDGDTVFYGLIAEEVHEAGLTEFVEYNDDNEPDALRYPHMVSLCIKAIQEQQTIIDDLKTRIETLENV
jgi:hypothetical protein